LPNYLNFTFWANKKFQKIKKILKNKKKKNEERKDYKWSGLDLNLGKIRNNLTAGVFEPMVSKVKSLRFATEAAITILRIDDMIKLHPKKEEMPDRHWESWCSLFIVRFCGFYK